MQVICGKCKGTGKVQQPLPSDDETDAEPKWIRCPACGGGGIIDTTAMA